MFNRRNNTNHAQENDEVHSESKVNELKAAIEPLSGRILQYCDDSCLRRYLEARNWNVDKSKKMMEETIKWRLAYKPEEVCWNEVAIESETGKMYKANFRDRQGRTVLIMRPGMQNTKSMDDQMRYLVYLLENVVLNLPVGQEQMAWLVDFTGWSLTNNVPIRTAREAINILQNHYPERLGMAFLYNPPRIFEALWKIVKYFIDAKTFEKLKFVYPEDAASVELMRSYFDDDNLPTEFGGKAMLKYDHEEFSRQMAQDDLKTAAFWGLDDKFRGVGDNGAEGATEPIPLALPTS